METTTYHPMPRWLSCADCGAMWTSHTDGPCWACDGPGHPARCPAINSQHGFAPADFDD